MRVAHNGENALVFALSPAGVRTVMAYNDVHPTLNFDWNAFWRTLGIHWSELPPSGSSCAGRR